MHDSSLLPLGRRRTIADRLLRGESVVANELAGEFDVSEDAIRRDLRALAQDGICKRVYGGALPLSPASTPMESRAVEDIPRKRALARAAVDLIGKGQSVFLDTGSTNLQLAGVLPTDRQLIVITNSIMIAAALANRTDISLFVIGGSVNTQVGGCVDARSIQEMRRFRIDLCFLGACAMSSAAGLAGFSMPDVDFKIALLEASTSKALMLTSAKAETTAPFTIGAVTDIDHVILERDAPVPFASKLRAAGLNIIVAGAPTE
ncbi:MAG: DeoR/GlpR transcriptional regulator [Mesorhizobium sp.]|uniref:DeoR/GlpR family DNA-binding transcription regulator n=1 Tax=Mesorhizobium sp. TaxID=1871066 RepID=UPI000FCB84B8|nr:DeoR/GlpR family DNA-binding transcription regulator [Mesorhizobium sp.]RUV23492.1 DeoR/GlpR transcriptional regulator [Mesorhizobium sp. M5C.F.Ca.IN.020.32.2.1]RUV63613.1 DeoR/GlpR transcriptional regulator [Mesorhizobium sp. M5C.F.Ca.IN.020.29.1.1]RUV96948.1 DeoR/GlpR transcriptional regulator [Mesorhizobium sp. M5C.F.Ca.IN.020.14.1.1]RWD51871.1 MAG: DeoR/GlpR transcriptional regulator [Mesorhizobium sp.]RWE14253.1 MAG: DeoR/GlpR transcriptional regulator [Mesorhizobium sp.]